MDYEKQIWANGQLITAEKLNHMEDGIEAAAASDFIITFSGSNITLDSAADKTWEEVEAAYAAGKRIRCQHIEADGSVEELVTVLQMSDNQLDAVKGGFMNSTYSNNSLTVLNLLCEMRSSSVEVTITMSEVAATPAN